MDLILWRHADAEDAHPDAQRRLTDKGHKQAARVARWLVDRLPKHYSLLVSPATRAQQTADALARKFETTEQVGLSASPASLLAAAEWPVAGATVVVVGHQPTLGCVAGLLLTGRDIDLGVRKGGLYWFTHRDGEIALKAVISPDLV
jgi:phosphohistidine phosphatase